MSLIRVLGVKIARLNRQASRKTLTALAALAVVASPLVGVASPASAVVDCATVFAGGTGTSADPWRVSNAIQLSALRDCGTVNKYFLQTQDISLSTMNPWTPIPSFSGNFDGAHMQISALTINLPAVQYVGLFSKLTTTSRIQSVHLQATVNGNYYAAGLAGENRGVISTSYVSASVTSASQSTAGLVGYNYGTIESSSAYVTISSAAMAGGLVGYNEGIIRNSYTQGTINAGDGGGLVGGQDGNWRSGFPNAIVGNSYSKVTVTSSVGGYGGGVLFRRMSKTTLEGSLFFQPGSGSLVASRFMGWDWVTPFVVPPEVFSKTAIEMKSFSTFGPAEGNWAIVDGWAEYNGTTQIWGICSGYNSGYPYLLWQNPTGSGCPKPGPPSGASATVGGTSATLTWTAPSFTGTSAITGYTVTSSVGSKTCSAASTARTCTVTGLTTGQSYTFTVTATNTSGTSGVSNAVTVTPMEIPVEVIDGVPTALASNASATLSWSNKASANVTGYLVTASPGGATCIAATSVVSNPSCTVNGLTNGTAYTFTVKTTNAAGSSLTASAASLPVTARTVPAAPAAPSVTPGSTQAVVAWTETLNDGGDSVTEYQVTSIPGSFTCTTSLLTCAVTGLTNGTAYTFTVAAKNQAGYSLDSAASTSATPRTNPGAPTAVLASGGNAFATVSWTAPVSDGGSAITNYVVSASPGAGTCTAVAPAVTCSVSGLTNGQAYTFTVVAHNAAGDSVSSSASTPVTPLTKPSSPMSVGAGYGNTTAQVTWLPSFSDGGSAVVSYTATSSPEGKTCTATAPSVSCEITGLTNGTAYIFTVTARSGAYATVGDSDPSSTTAAVTPRTNPGAPTTVLVTSGNAHAVVTWSAPVSIGGATISEYQVRAYDSADVSRGVCTVNMPAALSCDVTGLTNGTAYTFAVFAYNSEGYGPRSTRSSAATPLSSPGAPTSVLGVAGDAGVALAWTAPTVTGGTPVVTYTATASPGGASCTVLAPITTCDISGLTNGTNYTFTVAATNIIGTGSSSVSTGLMKPLSPAATSTTFEIVIDVVVGDPVAGGSAEFSSTGLEPSSPWTLVVHSTPRLLSSGIAGSAGTILGNATIPTGLEAGWHALTLAGRDYLGREASSTTWFEINAAGELIDSSRSDPTIDSAAAAKLANTGAATREIAALACALLAAGFFLVRRRKAGKS